MGERNNDETILEMALRRPDGCVEAHICGDTDAVEEHRIKSRVLLDMAIYADS